ncbi:MAG: polysaccharide deacetylase family protein [Syntrophomonas sp.]
MKGQKSILFLGEIIILTLLLVLLPCSSLSTPYLEDKLIYKVMTKEKVIAITFDDGPHPVYTPELLDILDKYGVKATFFMIGSQMERYPNIVKEVSRRGHIIGNHTYHHRGNLNTQSRSIVIGEMKHWDQTAERITGQETELFRPPRGLTGGNILIAAEEKGYTTVIWTICGDNHLTPTPELMAKRVEDRIGPGGIILLHDGATKSRWMDVKAADLIIKSLQQRGYRFVTIPELLKYRVSG